jgi:hypothetical protein
MFDAESWSRVRGISVATARAQLSQFRQRTQLFAIQEAGEDRYPRFQFDTEGVPLAGMAAILEVVPVHDRGWPVLSWFAASNVLLSGRRPYEVLQGNPLAVRDAAQEFYRYGRG